MALTAAFNLSLNWIAYIRSDSTSLACLPLNKPIVFLLKQLHKDTIKHLYKDYYRFKSASFHDHFIFNKGITKENLITHWKANLEKDLEIEYITLVQFSYLKL